MTYLSTSTKSGYKIVISGNYLKAAVDFKLGINGGGSHGSSENGSSSSSDETSTAASEILNNSEMPISESLQSLSKV